MFSNTKLNALMNLLVEKGIEITLTSQVNESSSSTMAFDLNTQTKSGIILSMNDCGKEATLFMRYNETETLDMEQPATEILHDLAYIVKDCMLGRDFVGASWAVILRDCKAIK